MSAPFTITRMKEHPLDRLCKPIKKGWNCPHCGEKPKGVQTYDGEKWMKEGRYYLAPHTCKGGTMIGGFNYTVWDCLHEYWGPWVKAQRKIIDNPPPAVKSVVKKSFWQKLLTGWN